MKKKLLLSIMVMVMSASLFACGSKPDTDGQKEEVVTESGTTNTTVDESSAVSSEQEPESTPVETVPEMEEEAVPYMVEKGFNFSKDLFYATSYALVFTNYDNTQEVIYPEYSVDLLDGFRCDIRSIDVKDSEEEGFVDVTIVTTGQFTPAFYYDASKGEGDSFRIRYNTPGISLVDIYTGRELPMRNTFNDEVVDVKADVEWEGVTYTVSYEKSITWNCTWDDWFPTDTGTSTFLYGNNEVIFDIHMPKAYDGLALAANISDKNKGVDFEIEEEVDYSERYVLDVEEGDETMEPADFYVITLSEIIAQLENE